MAEQQQTVDTKSMNIYQKMAAITAELITVAKSLEVKAGGGSYKAVSERDILDAVKPLEQKYGIYSYPCDREILEAKVLESESTYNNKTQIKSTFFTRIKTTYKFVNTDNPEEHITTITFSEGIDTQDKGSGKAMTYADKYALMKAYKISTGEDPDQNGSNSNNYRTQDDQPKNQQQRQNQQRGQQRPQNQQPNQQRAQQRSQAQQRPQPQQRPQMQGQNQQAPTGGPIYMCMRCGEKISDTPKKDGGTMTAAELAERSNKKYGAPLCANCQKEIAEVNRQAREESKQLQEQ